MRHKNLLAVLIYGILSTYFYTAFINGPGIINQVLYSLRTILFIIPFFLHSLLVEPILFLTGISSTRIPAQAITFISFAFFSALQAYVVLVCFDFFHSQTKKRKHH